MIRSVAGALAIGVLVLPAGPAAASPAAPRPSDVELVLLDQDFTVEPGGRWQATFAIEGDLDGIELATTTTAAPTSDTAAPSSTAGPSGSEVPPAAATTPPIPSTAPNSTARTETVTMRVAVHDPIEDRAELAAYLDGEARRELDSLSAPLSPSVTRAGGVTQLHVDAATTTEQSSSRTLRLRQPGLHPVTVQVLSRGEVIAEHRTLLDRQTVERRDPPPISIAVLAALPEPPPGQDDELTDEQRAAVEGLVELADAFPEPMTVAVPPAMVSGLTAEAPELGEALGEALRDDELVSLPSVVLDPSSAVAAGQSDTFSQRLLDGEELLGAVRPSRRSERSAWSTTAPISPAAGVLLRYLGFNLLVMDDTTYRALDGNIGGFFDTTLAVDVDLGDERTMPAMVRSPLGRLLDAQRTDPAGPVDAAVRLLAELVTTRRELGGDERRSVVLAVPDGRLPDPAVATALAELVDEREDVRFVTASALADSTDTMLIDGDPTTVALPAVAGPDLSARLERIDLTRLSAESAASMRLDDSAVTAWRAELDRLVTTALSDAEANAVLSRIAAEADAVRAAVVAPQPFDFTLTGRSSTLRLNLRNNAAEPLRVIVRARSAKLTFPDGDQLVELVPLGVTEVAIPVEARSNGTTSVEVDLLTPELGQPVNGSVVLTAHANALTGLGQVITVGAMLVLISWWFSHHRRQRRARLVVAETAATLEHLSPDAAEVTVVGGSVLDEHGTNGDVAPERVSRS